MERRQPQSMKDLYLEQMQSGIGNITAAEGAQPPGNRSLGWAINYLHKREPGHPLNTRLSWQERRISSEAASYPSLLIIIIIKLASRSVEKKRLPREY